MVYMENRRNSSLQATGYVLVKVEDTHPQMIAIGYILSIFFFMKFNFIDHLVVLFQ
jgi:hypothetical protein